MTTKHKSRALSIIISLICVNAHAGPQAGVQQPQETVQNIDPQRVAAIASYLASGGLRHLTDAEVSPEELKAAQEQITTPKSTQKKLKNESSFFCFTPEKVTDTLAPTTSTLAEALKERAACQTPLATAKSRPVCHEKAQRMNNYCNPAPHVYQGRAATQVYHYPAPPDYCYSP